MGERQALWRVSGQMGRAMEATRYTYEDCIHNSEKVAWRIDDVLPVGSRLDFTRAFLPEVMVRSKVLAFLSDMERLKLNHIFANAYLNLFAFVEEYIAADIVRHANAAQFGDDHALRALRDRESRKKTSGARALRLRRRPRSRRPRRSRTRRPIVVDR